MTLRNHLLELRRRLTIVAIALLCAAVIGWLLSGYVWDALRGPVLLIAQSQGRNAAINYPSLSSAFDLKIQISMYVGIVISSPVWISQLFGFFLPGLSKSEKRYALGFLCAAAPLFLMGCLAGWFVVPHIVALLTGFAPSQDAAFIDAKQYFDFVLKLVVATGVAFVLPVFLVCLNFLGLLQGKTLLTSWRVALLAIVGFTAIATPAADVMSMFLLAIPMVMLYFAAVGVALLHDRRIARRDAAEMIETEAPLRSVAVS